MPAPRRACPACGRRVLATDPMCLACGAKLPASWIRDADASDAGSRGTRGPTEPVWRVRQRAQRRSRRLLLVLISLIVIVLLIAAVWYLAFHPAGTTAAIIADGTSYTIVGGSFNYTEFSLTQSEHLSGAFRASADVGAYILNHSEFDKIFQNGTPQNWTWTSGNVTSATIGVQLSRGTWVFEFVNPSPSSNVTVNITKAVVATG